MKYFVGRFSDEYGKSVHYVADQTIHKLQSYTWPGNVRELENHLRRAVLMCKGDVLLAEHVQFEAEQGSIPQAGTQDETIHSLKRRLADLVPEILRLADDERVHANIMDLVEEALITRALQECQHNQVRTAQKLGISRNTLRHRIKKYNLGPTEE